MEQIPQTVWRTPTTHQYGAQGSNRWVRAYTKDGAYEQCHKSFGVYPVAVFPAPGGIITLWEKPDDSNKVRKRS